jgi:hypothetical protein
VELVTGPLRAQTAGKLRESMFFDHGIGSGRFGLPLRGGHSMVLTLIGMVIVSFVCLVVPPLVRMAASPSETRATVTAQIAFGEN